MRVLVTWASKMGGTRGIAEVLAHELEESGFTVVRRAAGDIGNVRPLKVDAVIVGGALYANRWHAAARQFVLSNMEFLRTVPVWFFSSGPLDDSAKGHELPPAPQVQVLMARAGAQGHRTFGGRLPMDAKGFPAAAMAKQHAGDWRDMRDVRDWAKQLAMQLPMAKPLPRVQVVGGSWQRLLAHGALGWALCATVMFALLQMASVPVAITLHALAVPLIFVSVAQRYFHLAGARDPLPTALAFTGIVGVLDVVVVALLIQHSFAIFGSFTGTWLPLALVFVATWVTGEIMSMMPWPDAHGKNHA